MSALVGPADGEHEAELRRPHRRGLRRRPSDLVVSEKREGLDGRFELGRLGAEVAVLGAAAGLGRQDALDLDLGAAPGQANGMGEGGEIVHLVVGERSQLGDVGENQRATVIEQGGGGTLQDV